MKKNMVAGLPPMDECHFDLLVHISAGGAYDIILLFVTVAAATTAGATTAGATTAGASVASVTAAAASAHGTDAFVVTMDLSISGAFRRLVHR
jgi:hypothetical protein